MHKQKCNSPVGTALDNGKTTPVSHLEDMATEPSYFCTISDSSMFEEIIHHIVIKVC